jgi:hypothetical protein
LSFPKANWCDIRDKDGKWIRPREFIKSKNPMAEYRIALTKHYNMRHKKIRKFFEGIDDEENVALLCWCPYERAAQRQLRQFGSYICHLSVIGRVLDDMGYSVWLDSDRLRMAVLEQKGY